ncbi:hypothetical protein D477_000150 [Arthrobacter crystallopoietes BAB-32]|uniref:Uncharacterized protein n=1 Tax=Arthrobacter crystallopoietes BAB-32 TaxID=1246476 RepID=N1V8A7_9MICC|nr:hypothetical protein [Arthrobacter crystallopoietes]EMY36234.1 hypothetical protein D477_000150 [Arthrobacter crystallopoietes BAB-32]
MAEMIWNEGEHIEALDLAGTRISGTVEQVAPEIGAAWIREDGLGERRLVITDDAVASD